jgi:hypothetical protein
VVVAHAIPISQAVEMFIRNFHTLRANPVVRDDYNALDAITQGLRNLRQAPPTDRIVWDMCQVVLERESPVGASFKPA